MVKRVARVQLPKKPLFEKLTFVAKNLYNSATYLVRQTLFKTGKRLRYYSLWNLLKNQEDYLKLKELSGSQTPQQLLLMVDACWKGHYAAKKDWETNPEKYLGKPKIPGYLPKNGRFVVTWSNQQVRVRNGKIRVPERLITQGFPVIPIEKLPVTEANIGIVRLKTHFDKFILEIVYEKEIQTSKQDKPEKILGLDLGLSNLVATSDGMIVKGGIVKSINQFYNKQKATLQKQLSKQGLTTSKRKQQLMRLRYSKLHDLFHKASRKIIAHCVRTNVTVLVIGRNKNWKQSINIGKRNNQNFVSVPFYKLIQMLQYKAEAHGIEVKLVTEEYTSQTCSCCGYRSRRNRKHRGLFVCRQCHVVLNADVNAARNIAKKALPEFERIGDRGCVAQPAKLTL
ncbi:MAG: RNA-guided endonuclease InsQ/TnpB family protein [Candidatus Heimdallarchaeota archaeon]